MSEHPFTGLPWTVWTHAPNPSPTLSPLNWPETSNQASSSDHLDFPYCSASNPDLLDNLLIGVPPQRRSPLSRHSVSEFPSSLSFEALEVPVFSHSDLEPCTSSESLDLSNPLSVPQDTYGSMNFANIFDNEVVLPLHLGSFQSNHHTRVRALIFSQKPPEKSHDSSTTASQHLQSALQTPATTSPSSSSSATDLTLTSQKRKHPSVSKDDDTIANKRRRQQRRGGKVPSEEARPHRRARGCARRGCGRARRVEASAGQAGRRGRNSTPAAR